MKSERPLMLYTDQNLASDSRWLKVGLVVYTGVIALSSFAASELPIYIPEAKYIIEGSGWGLALATAWRSRY